MSVFFCLVLLAFAFRVSPSFLCLTFRCLFVDLDQPALAPSGSFIEGGSRLPLLFRRDWGVGDRVSGGRDLRSSPSPEKVRWVVSVFFVFGLAVLASLDHQVFAFTFNKCSWVLYQRAADGWASCYRVCSLEPPPQIKPIEIQRFFGCRFDCGLGVMEYLKILRIQWSLRTYCLGAELSACRGSVNTQYTWLAARLRRTSGHSDFGCCPGPFRGRLKNQILLQFNADSEPQNI
jgi:hypothetical protein